MFPGGGDGGKGVSKEQLAEIFKNMQKTIQSGYVELAELMGGRVAPVGLAWEASCAKFPELDLYKKDANHPSPLGTYLTSLVFYRSLFGELPEVKPKEAISPVDDEVHKKLISIVSKLDMK